VTISSVSPVPSEEEAAAIVAAVEMTWPRPITVVSGDAMARASGWRWSGRWWARPVAARRDRPWY
jgi:hypothetical protein